MSLTIHTEEDNERQLSVTIEVPEERVQAQMKRTARDLARQVNIPGFRKGKVPYNVLVQRIGAEAIRADAVEEMIEPILEEALEEIDAVAFRQPTLDDIDMEPLVLKLTIPLEPKIALGDYRAIRKEVSDVQVEEEALEEALEHIRSHHQVLEDVNRPVETGDMVTLTGTGKIDDNEGETIWSANSNDLVMDPGRVFPDLPVVENILGLSAGDKKEFRFTFPEDYEEEELAGKEVVFEINVERVQSRELPELNDELAQKEGRYETLEALKESLQKELFEQAERQASSDLFDEVIEEMVAEAEVVFPPAVVESELDSNIKNFKEQITRSGMQWEDYMKLEGESEASLRDKWREGATERVRRGLVIGQFIREEGIKVESADIDSAVDKRLDQFGDNEELREQLRSVFTQGSALEMMSNEVLMDKAMERVREIVTGVAPPLPEATEPAPEGSDEEE